MQGHSVFLGEYMKWVSVTLTLTMTSVTTTLTLALPAVWLHGGGHSKRVWR